MLKFARGTVSTTQAAYSPLRLHASNQLLSRAVSGKGTTIYSTIANQNQGYVKNSDCWCSTIDLTCVPTGQYADPAFFDQPRGCLITSKHVVTANHVGITTGSNVVFVGSNGTTYLREVTAQNNTIGNDALLLRLASDLPAQVSPAKLLPADFEDYLVADDYTQKIPTIVVDKQMKALAYGFYDVHQYGGEPFESILASQYTTGQFATFSESLVSGDSGSPLFFIINGEAVLASCAESVFAGPALHQRITQINSILNAWDSGYAVETVDLTEFAL